ncbi:MAG: hypothetical protein AAB794_00985 [Patescibacteria group bacterium]
MATLLPKDDKGYSVNLDVNNPRRDEICDFLDSFNALEKFCEVRPSILLKGGWYAMQRENRIQNLDWMAQSAHSFREIHYGILDSKTLIFKTKRFLILNAIKFFNYKTNNIPKTRKDKISDSLKTYVADEAKRQEISTAINKVHIAFTKIAHHFKERDSLKDTLKIFVFLKITQSNIAAIEPESFESLVDIFENLILDIKPRGLTSHKIIDDILLNKNFDEKIIRSICLSGGNPDTKRYFFSKADEIWLKWLWEKGLLDDLKKPALDTSKYSYRLPELEYLTRMVGKEPKMVTEIMNSVTISKETFNPEVVDRFTWIISLLPVEQTKILFPKILRESWVQLMSPFHRSGYEYIKIVEKLKESGDPDALIGLAKIILTPRSKEEVQAINGYISSDKLFYLNDITETGLFDLLLDTRNTEKEKTLALALDVLGKVVTNGKDREVVFKESEPFYLLDVDIFTIEVNNERKSYTKDDIENLIALAKKLIDELFSSACDNPAEVRRLYDTNISGLPDSRTLYKLRLYTATRCPSVFRQEIKTLLFRVFEVGERYFEIEGGAEYHSALIAGFSALDADTAQREYVAKVFEYFGAKLENEDKEKWRREAGLEIVTYIKTYLTKEEIEQSEKLFGKLPEGKKLSPHPEATMGEAGIVAHRSPINVSEFSVEQIVEHLKTDWSPTVLKEQYGGDDFLSPRGTEGLGDALKDDVKKRLDSYLEKINDFFDRDNIAPHYVYSVIRGIEEMLRNKEKISLEQAGKLVDFFEFVKNEGLKTPFKKADDKEWLADWIEVHKVIVDALLYLTENKDLKVSLHSAYRDKIRDIISYLLTIESSPSKEHEKPEYGEPYHVAINSVRGRAYEAFVIFTENDGKALAEDVKSIYRQSLNDESIAVHFVIGRYLATFYFRDKEFIKETLPEIFPKDDPVKKDMYLASWEGYLSNTLYDKLFAEFKNYYEHAIMLDPSVYTERKYTRSLDELLATHLALAYANLDLKIGDPLFDLFWKTPNATRHYEFASFLGRSCLTRDSAGDEWLKENKVSKEKLIEFWNWMLATDIPIDAKAFAGFGFWVNPDKEVIDEKIIVKNLVATLKKSNGEIDWDYGLMQRLKVFAGIDPVNTLEIIKNYLLLDGELNPHRRSPLFSLENEIKEALVIIYKDPTLKSAVKDLVDILIEKGSSSFWGLKDVLGGISK